MPATQAWPPSAATVLAKVSYRDYFQIPDFPLEGGTFPTDPTTIWHPFRLGYVWKLLLVSVSNTKRKTHSRSLDVMQGALLVSMGFSQDPT